ncbi:hypothetical protein I2I11_09760 [Pontibacter sp. 172403-2]|uniref:hypothetical protein n=1 Tax=Pontibacter rufus TaxID=2791028 RepID=UPI0018AF6EA6|nr:hypothetical protein [Pontibacter sp. 172403-2]MBF9253576.1 hypothetical protein [Pontibacter sp. 172403-2]
MKKLTLVSLLVFTAPLAMAQTIPVGNAAQQNLNELGDATNISGMVMTYDRRYEGVKGSPFFLDKWGKATIHIPDNLIFDNVPVKYNVYENVVQFQKGDGKTYLLPPNKIDYFVLKDTLGARSYTFRKVPEISRMLKSPTDRFAIVLHEGKKSTMVLLPGKSLVKADFKGGYSAGRTFDELVTENDYYLIKQGEEPQKVKLSKRSLLKALQDKQQQVEDFISKQNIDADTEEGWMETLAFYDSL